MCIHIGVGGRSPVPTGYVQPHPPASLADPSAHGGGSEDSHLRHASLSRSNLGNLGKRKTPLKAVEQEKADLADFSKKRYV